MQSTMDYGIFKKSPSNRDTDDRNIQRIQKSIQQKNLLHHRPILVNEKMEVIDGQNRLEAAKRSNLPVFFEVSNDSTTEDIYLLNINQKTWQAQDYVKYFCSLGKEEYIRLHYFMEEKKISLKMAMILLTSNRGAEPYYDLKQGLFQFPNEEEMQVVNQYLDQIAQITDFISLNTMGSKHYLKKSTFIYSALKFLSSPNVNFNIFMKKLEMKLAYIRPCTLAKEYITMFKAIYNWKNQDPIE